MCTKQEVEQVIDNEFHKEGGHREAILDDVRNELNAMIVKVIAGVGITVLTAGVTFTIFLNNLANDVEDLNGFANSGDRFTAQEAALLELQIQANTEAIKESASSEDVKDLKEAFIRLDDRLREKGI